MADPQDVYRPLIDPENTAKIRAAEQSLRDKHGIVVPGHRIVNALLSSVDLIEFTQEIHVTLTLPDPTGTVPIKKRKRKYTSRITWATRI